MSGNALQTLAALVMLAIVFFASWGALGPQAAGL